jgi:hypothetical protein
MAFTDKLFPKCVSYIPRLEIKYYNLNTLGLSSFDMVNLFLWGEQAVQRNCDSHKLQGIPFLS